MEGAMPEIGLFEAIHTARSSRRFKPDPVPEALITQVLDAAVRAPTAGNAQNWAFVVIRDREMRRALGAI
jgi:nitroreductase